jgi:hypothetical protein
VAVFEKAVDTVVDEMGSFVHAVRAQSGSGDGRQSIMARGFAFARLEIK